jgi:hypothetical protein
MRIGRGSRNRRRSRRWGERRRRKRSDRRREKGDWGGKESGNNFSFCKMF